MSFENLRNLVLIEEFQAAESQPVDVPRFQLLFLEHTGFRGDDLQSQTDPQGSRRRSHLEDRYRDFLTLDWHSAQRFPVWVESGRIV